VILRLVVKAGAEADPPGAYGTAQLVSALLNQGTRNRSALQIAEAIDEAGGSIDTGAEWDSSYAALSVLSDHTRQAFELLADMVRDPSFQPGDVARKRQQTLSALEVAHDDPGYVADTLIQDLVLAGTPYGHPQDGTPASVRGLTSQDLRAFHARYYRPGDAYLAVEGDVSTGQAFQLAEQFFGDWQGSEIEKRESGVGSRESENQIPGGSDPRPRLMVIDKPDAVQTEIRVGEPGIARGSSQYDALTVANQVLGGPATNRLFNALRTREGLTYGASSKLVCFRSAGIWEISTFTRTAETAKTLGVVLDVMKGLRDHSIRDSELLLAQGYLQGHLALRFETAAGLAKAQLDLLVHGMPADYWNFFAPRIQALDARQVGKVMRRYLHPDRSVIVLVGDAQAFRSDLKPFGKARVIPLARLDLGSASLEAPVTTGAAQPRKLHHPPKEQGTGRTFASR
jgi:zinc protease